VKNKTELTEEIIQMMFDLGTDIYLQSSKQQLQILNYNMFVFCCLTCN